MAVVTAAGQLIEMACLSTVQVEKTAGEVASVLSTTSTSHRPSSASFRMW
jgi:hypothetical protein